MAMDLDAAARRKGPIAARYSGAIDGDFVVFLIGMRINRWWKPHRWVPPFLAMGPMLRELARDPDSGLLSFRYIGKLSFVQYWRSFEHLERFALAPGGRHRAAWRALNRAGGDLGDIGLWHETYLVRAGAYEAVYSGMPPIGLAAAGRIEDAAGRRGSARRRLGLETGEPDAAPDRAAAE